MVLLSLTFSTIGNTNDVIFIEKNVPAPFSGILFPEDKARQLRSDLLESDKLAIKYEGELGKSKSLLQEIKLKDEEIELFLAQNARLVKQNKDTETMRYIWFGLGILATGVAVYGAGSLAR